MNRTARIASALLLLVSLAASALAQEYGRTREFGGKLMLNYSNLNQGTDLDTGTDPLLRYGFGLTARIYANAYRKVWFGGELLFLRTGHRYESSSGSPRFSFKQEAFQSYLTLPVMMGVRILKPRAGSWFVYAGAAPMYLLGSRVDYRYTFGENAEVRSFRYNPFERWDVGAFAGASYSPRLKGELYLNFDLRAQVGLMSQGDFYRIERQHRAYNLQRHFIQLSVGIDKVEERAAASRSSAVDRRLSRNSKLFEDVNFKCGDRYCHLDKDTKRRLDKLARFIENNPDILVVTITGHADPSEPGEPRTREMQSRARALSVKGYLIRQIRRADKRRKIDQSIKTVWVSDSKAKYPAGDPRNCRVEISYQFAQ